MRVALSVPPRLEDELAEQADRHGHRVLVRASSADEAGIRVAGERIDVVLAHASPRYLTARLLGEADAAGALVLALADDDAGRGHAHRVGVLEPVDARAGCVALEERMRAIGSITAVPGAAAPRGGMVVAVWGPAGAPGRTTVAIAVAAELAASGARVVLADADTYGASIAPALGLLDESPGFAAACRLAGSDALTAAELDRLAQHCVARRGAFRVLTGIGRPSRWPELSASRVERTIAACRDWADVTVLDVGFSLEDDEEIMSDIAAPRRNGATLAALRTADRVLAVGAADPIGLSRFLRAHVDLLETVAPDAVTVVMNKVRSGAVGPAPQTQVATALERFGGIVAPVLVPYDQAGADAALLTAAPLPDAAPRSAASTAIADLVTGRLLPAPAPHPTRRSRLRRLVPGLAG